MLPNLFVALRVRVVTIIFLTRSAAHNYASIILIRLNSSEFRSFDGTEDRKYYIITRRKNKDTSNSNSLEGIISIEEEGRASTQSS